MDNIWAVDLDSEWLPPTHPNARYINVRPGVYSLNPYESSVLALASAMIDWNTRHKYCPACGSLTTSTDAGYKRKCSMGSCAAHKSVQNYAYPRTDAVCIMHIISKDGNRCLLGRKATWPPTTFSCIGMLPYKLLTQAGFIEPGEILEDAARREAFEETGIIVGNVRYNMSQVWPFPSQLMLGCTGWALSEVIDRIDEELEDVRWFGLDEVRKMVDGTSEFMLPRKHAIAHHLVKEWVESVDRSKALL